MAFSFVCIIHRCLWREINATQSSVELSKKVIRSLLASQPGQRVGEGIYQAAAKQFSTVDVVDVISEVLKQTGKTLEVHCALSA